MKCQVVINSREKLANIIDSFHYAKSTYNWPRGSLLPLRTNVESSGFSAKIKYLSSGLGFIGQPFAAGSQSAPKRFAQSSFSRQLRDTEWSGKPDDEDCLKHSKVVFIHMHSLQRGFFFLFHHLTCCKSLTSPPLPPKKKQSKETS